MAEDRTDPLSPLAHEIIKAGTYDRLVVDGGEPAKARDLLSNVSPDQLLSVPVRSLGDAYAMLAGLWLWHDALHECHEIAQADVDSLQRTALSLHRKRSNPSQNPDSVQRIETDKAKLSHEIVVATTSLNFWHAIMHRREGDFSNAKYWYARCENHPTMQTLTPFVNDVLHPLPADKALLRLMRGGWDPGAFVDLVEQVHDRPGDPRHGAAVALQRLEWRLLFEHSMRAASGQ